MVNCVNACPCTYCHAFNRCCRNAVSELPSASCVPVRNGLCHVSLTCGPPALCLLRLLLVRVLARYRVGLLDLLCLRHVEDAARFRGSGSGKEGAVVGSLMRFAAEVAGAFGVWLGVSQPQPQPCPILDTHLTPTQHRQRIPNHTQEVGFLLLCILQTQNKCWYRAYCTSVTVNGIIVN